MSDELELSVPIDLAAMEAGARAAGEALAAALDGEAAGRVVGELYVRLLRGEVP
jgi:hypothetical protein